LCFEREEYGFDWAGIAGLRLKTFHNQTLCAFRLTLNDLFANLDATQTFI